MPGDPISRTGLSAIDVAADVIGPASSPQDEREIDQDQVVAAEVRLAPNKRDQTWAFNQATGARYDSTLARRQQPNPVDHVEGAIHQFYPSLNRLPGTIYVPPGRYYIYGTITLFAGQRLVGASSVEGGPDSPGSVLIKVGTGPCIRVLAAHDLDALFELDPEDILDLWAEGNPERPGGGGSLRLETSPASNLLEGGPGNTSERRKSVIAQFASGIGPAFISHLRVQYEALPDDPDLLAGLQLEPPRPPQEDQFSTPAVGDFFLTEIPLPEEPRRIDYRRVPHLPVYDSGGIELVNPAYSNLHDVAVAGFVHGYGIHAYGNHINANTIGNQMERITVERCHRGIILSRSVLLDAALNDRNTGDTVEDGVLTVHRNSKNSTANSWTLLECDVRGCDVVGVECHAGTSRFLFCNFEHDAENSVGEEGQLPPPPNGALVLAAGSGMVYGCSFGGSGPRVLLAQQVRSERRRQKVENPSSANTLFLQNTYRSAGRDGAPRPIVATELPDGVAARRAWVGRVLSEIGLPRGGGGVDATRGPEGNVLDHSQPDGPSASTWSIDNLLYGTLFERVRGDFDDPGAEAADWLVEGDARTWRVQAVEVDEFAEYVGPALQIKYERVAGVEPMPLWISQRIAAPWTLGASTLAWAARNWMRGRRLVGAAWVHANIDRAAQVGFRQTPTDPANTARDVLGRGNTRVNEWMFLNGFLDPVSVEFPMQEEVLHTNFQGEHGLWGVDFVMKVNAPPKGADLRVLIGAPQVTWGPDLLPVGPPRIHATNSRRVGPTEIGPLELAQGFILEEQLELRPGATAAEGILGTAGEIEALHASAQGSSGTGTFTVELVPLGKTATTLAEVTVVGGEAKVEELTPSPWHCPGVARLVLRRQRSDAGLGVALVAALRHSRSI